MSTFRALSIRNYRIYWYSQFLSQIGYWLQFLAASNLIYRLTGSEKLLGAMVFCNFIPILPLSTFSGAIINRIDKPKAVAITQTLALLQAALLAYLTFSDMIEVWHLLSLSLFLCFVAAFDMPLRQLTLIDLVNDRSMLSNAIALNSLQFNIARVIGPSIAAFILYYGEAWCFLLNSMSYLCLLFAMLFIKWPQNTQPVNEDKINFLKNWYMGVLYIKSHIPIRTLLIIITIAALTISTYSAIVPALALKLFNGHEAVQSNILAAAGIGAIIGNLWLANLKDPHKLLFVVFFMGCFAAISYIALSFVENRWLGYGFFLIIGSGIIMVAASVNSLLQMLAGRERRAEVVGFYIACFSGCFPVGAFLVGYFSEYFGVRLVLLSVGIAGLCNMLYFALQFKVVSKIVKEIFKEQENTPF